MTNRKDLLEAQAYSRRRLVTAFVGGAPDGRETESWRPVRPLAGGVVLTLLLALGAAALELIG